MLKRTPTQMLMLAALLLGVFCACSASADDPSLRLVIGTGVTTDRGGIYASSLSLVDGSLTPATLATPANWNTYLDVNPRAPIVYSISELKHDDHRESAAVIAWKWDWASGKLHELNRQPAGGDGPCHVCVNASANRIAITNYSSGSVSLYPLDSDGRIGPMSDNVPSIGSGPDLERQSRPHAHSVQFSAKEDRLFVADLGTDDIFVYRIRDDGKLQPAEPPSFRMTAGSGPRHFAFSPDGRFLLALGELTGVIATFAPDSVERKPLFETSTMAPTAAADQMRHSAEILFHPVLPVVYCSNRGPNEIATFSYDVATGKVTRTGAISCGGKMPRNFRLTPEGDYLLVANQGSNQVNVFKVDTSSGSLEATKHSISVPAPMCIKFINP